MLEYDTSKDLFNVRLIVLSFFLSHCFFICSHMQAQKEAPLDMKCKAKFLVQSVVPTRMTAVEITPNMVGSL